MIIITTYHGRNNDKRFRHRREYLEETIRSIDMQGLENIFHLIVDDGSTDDTYLALSEKWLNSKNRRIVKRSKGVDEPFTSTNARNFGVDLCLNSFEIAGVDISKHEYITFIDSDDVVINLIGRIKILETKMPDFLYTDVLLFFDDTDTAFYWKGITPAVAYNNFWIYGQMPYPSMTWKVDFLRLLKKTVQEKYGFDGPFNPQIGCGEDVDVALSSFECAQINQSIVEYLPEITAGYRIHDSSLSVIRSQNRRKKEENSVIIRHFGRRKAALLHLCRFLIRTECYIPQLLIIKNYFRRKTSKGRYLNSLVPEK